MIIHSASSRRQFVQSAGLNDASHLTFLDLHLSHARARRFLFGGRSLGVLLVVVGFIWRRIDREEWIRRRSEAEISQGGVKNDFLQGCTVPTVQATRRWRGLKILTSGQGEHFASPQSRSPTRLRVVLVLEIDQLSRALAIVFSQLRR